MASSTNGNRLTAIDSARGAIRAGLLLLLAIAVLPFGGVEPGWVLTLELWSVSLAAAAAIVLVLERRQPSRDAVYVGALASVVLLVGVLQLVPLDPLRSPLVSSATVGARSEVWQALPEFQPQRAAASLDATATADALLRYAAWIGVGLASYVAFRDRRSWRVAAITVAVCGAFQALYGAAEYLSGHQQIFAYRKVHFADAASGTFINRNHFAAYLAGCLPLALALALSRTPNAGPGNGWRRLVLRATDARGARRIAGAVAAASIWIGLVLSYSRGGLAAGLAGVAVFGWSVSADRRRIGAIFVLLAVATLPLLLQEVRAPGERFADASGEIRTLNGRAPVWAATARLAARSLPLGTGLGTFGVAFPRFRGAEINARWDHAHNEWLQAAAEGGPLVALAAIAALITALRAGRRPRDRRNGTRPILAATAAGIVALALHALVDFPLRIPAIAILLAVLVGVRLAVSESDVPTGRARTA